MHLFLLIMGICVGLVGIGGFVRYGFSRVQYTWWAFGLFAALVVSMYAVVPIILVGGYTLWREISAPRWILILGGLSSLAIAALNTVQILQATSFMERWGLRAEWGAVAFFLGVGIGALVNWRRPVGGV